MAEQSTAVVMLAAGAGSRFGGAKLDADLGGRPVGRWAADAAEAADFAKRIIITPPTPPAFVDALVGWDRVINDDNSGMTSSIRAAAMAAAGTSRVVIILADMPLIDADHLNRLAQGQRVAFTRYADGRNGVPAAFPAETYAILAGLSDGLSPTALDWDIGVDVIEPLSSLSLMDIDTAADLAVVRSMVMAQ